MVAPLLISKAPVSLPLGGAHRSVQPIPSPSSFYELQRLFLEPKQQQQLSALLPGRLFLESPWWNSLEMLLTWPLFTRAQRRRRANRLTGHLLIPQYLPS